MGGHSEVPHPKRVHVREGTTEFCTKAGQRNQEGRAGEVGS